MIHVGKMLKEYFDSLPRKYTVSWLASMLNCDRTNIYNIFQRSSVDTHLLVRISIILEHNFFQDIADMIESEKSSVMSQPVEK